MGAEKPAESRDVRFEDLDLIYIIPFDLGAPVDEDLKETIQRVSERCEMVEEYWIFSEETSAGLKSPIFQMIIKEDKSRLDIDYLKRKRYARLKLSSFYLRTEDQGLNLQQLECEPYLLLHKSGIGVLTIWIHLYGGFTADELIDIKKKLFDAKSKIKYFAGDASEETLREFVDHKIMPSLRNAVLLSEKARVQPDLRTRYAGLWRVICIRKHSCNDRCSTAEDAIKRHLRELAGIAMRDKGWRDYREEAARDILGENLSYSKDYAMFVTNNVSLFLGSAKLDEKLKVKDDKDLAYREKELPLIQTMEILVLSDMILRVYTSIYRNKFSMLKGRRRKVMKPSEIAEMREDLLDALEEYRSVLLFTASINRRILEKGKERLELLDEADALRLVLQELDEIARTIYEEDISKTQAVLTVLFGISTVLPVAEVLEFVFGSILTKLKAIIIASAIILPYPIYKLSSLYEKKWIGIILILMLELFGIYQVF
uniref:Uncharacterized protein n=1 Tax=Thermofilum adornatum TaxID=1365176 RepID=A0A7C1CGR3_9CREN